VTVSVGVASWSPSIGRPWQLLREAEARLTDARVAGRNRVCGA
jgi:PleD family two-component response regulator